MSGNNVFDELNAQILGCDRCPRLRAHCREIARVKRASYQDQTYHGRPVPNFGDPDAAILVLGLAPGAHGANRTGRMFTGDRSGDFLYKVMHDAGLANQPHATDAEDGLTLIDTAITAAAHCAPPGNKPSATELAACVEHLQATIDALPRLRVIVCLGGIALTAMLREAKHRGWIDKMSPYRFAHGARFDLAPGPIVLCAYHPSQQNTFTGRLTEAMLLDVFRDAAARVNRPR